MWKYWFFFMMVVVGGPLCAQEFGPETPILGKTTFGINGMAVMEVALPSEISYNPAATALALEIFEEKQYAEIDFGVLDFHAGPEVKNDWQILLFRLPGGALRIAQYGINSNSREIAYLGAGPEVEFNGQTVELSYGRKVLPNLFLGLALIPSEEIKTNISFEGVELAKAKAKSAQHGRLGALYLPNPKLSLGAVYTYDKIKAKTQLLPALTGESVPIDMNANYREKLWTIGAAWQPREGTAFFWVWQKGKISGPNVSEEIDLHAFGVQQFLSRNVSVRIENNDKVWGYGLTYFYKGWTLGASYSKNTYRRIEEYLGRADAWYVWVGKSW